MVGLDDIILTDIRSEGSDGVRFNMHIQSADGSMVLNQQALQQAVEVRA